MKSLLTATLLLFSSTAIAQALMVNIYEPLPGGVRQTMAYAQEAKGIHEAMGATVEIASDLDGNMHYAMSFESWESWGRFSQQLATNEQWNTFTAKTDANPSAKQIDNYLLYEVAPGEPTSGGVYQVYIWKANQGKVNQMLEGGTLAKPLHEKYGVNVTVLADQLNRMHFVMQFDSWEAWGKYQETPNPEFQAFMAERSIDPAAEMIKVYTASVVP